MGRCRAALIVAALSLLPCGPASAADAAKAGKSPIIAVLDGQRVLRGSEAAKSIRQVVDARRAQYEAEIETQRKTLKTEEDKLRRQATVLSPEAMRDRRRTLEQKFADLRRQAEQRRGVLTRAFNAAMLRLR
ncbi:MAG: OmpH family outer membrane protein, partial [Alphaproteobacteria bacterium]|nr:OmpH family outer membrane protein [Alphaproteobacteria bacterium]